MEHYLYIGGLLEAKGDNFLDYNVKVGISQDYQERYNFMGVKNPYQFEYYDVYKINSSSKEQAKKLAHYFEKKVLALYIQNRHKKSEFLKFDNKSELGGFITNIYNFIMDIQPFLKENIHIEQVDSQSNQGRSDIIRQERERFTKEFLPLFPTNKEILGVSSFSYSDVGELDVLSDEEVYKRFSDRWVANLDRVKNCEYGVLFYDRKIQAVFKIEDAERNPEDERVIIKATREKMASSDILESEYDMFVANPVMYLHAE